MTNEKTPVITRSLETDSHTEYYLTGRAAATREAAREVFARAAETLAQKKIQVLHEKMFGLRSERAQLLEMRREAYCAKGLDATVPVTFLQGTPTGSGPFAGLQIWGIAPRTPGERLVEPIERRGAQVGCRWKGKGFRLLTLSSVDGAASDGKKPDCAPCQAKNMFVNASAALAANDLSFKKVVRTWIYLARILDWYGDFNRVRTTHFAKEGLTAGGGSLFPASTGIQATSDGEECLMDVLALDAEPASGVSMQPVGRSSRQDKASSYGSSFSRATLLSQRGHKTLYISGTASIDSAGRSTHLEDAEAQTLDTLLSIAALLEDQGMSLADLCQATVYCKNTAAVEAWDSVCRRLQLPEIPAVCVVADVCRPELLIEIEAIGIR